MSLFLEDATAFAPLLAAEQRAAAMQHPAIAGFQTTATTSGPDEAYDALFAAIGRGDIRPEEVLTFLESGEAAGHKSDDPRMEEFANRLILRVAGGEESLRGILRIFIQNDVIKTADFTRIAARVADAGDGSLDRVLTLQTTFEHDFLAAAQARGTPLKQRLLMSTPVLAGRAALGALSGLVASLRGNSSSATAATLAEQRPLLRDGGEGSDVEGSDDPLASLAPRVSTEQQRGIAALDGVMSHAAAAAAAVRDGGDARSHVSAGSGDAIARALSIASAASAEEARMHRTASGTDLSRMGAGARLERLEGRVRGMDEELHSVAAPRGDGGDSVDAAPDALEEEGDVRREAAVSPRTALAAARPTGRASGMEEVKGGDPTLEEQIAPHVDAILARAGEIGRASDNVRDWLAKRAILTQVFAYHEAISGASVVDSAVAFFKSVHAVLAVKGGKDPYMAAKEILEAAAPRTREINQHLSGLAIGASNQARTRAVVYAAALLASRATHVASAAASAAASALPPPPPPPAALASRLLDLDGVGSDGDVESGSAGSTPRRDASGDAAAAAPSGASREAGLAALAALAEEEQAGAAARVVEAVASRYDETNPHFAGYIREEMGAMHIQAQIRELAGGSRTTGPLTTEREQQLAAEYFAGLLFLKRVAVEREFLAIGNAISPGQLLNLLSRRLHLELPTVPGEHAHDATILDAAKVCARVISMTEEIAAAARAADSSSSGEPSDDEQLDGASPRGAAPSGAVVPQSIGAGHAGRAAAAPLSVVEEGASDDDGSSSSDGSARAGASGSVTSPPTPRSTPREGGDGRHVHFPSRESQLARSLRSSRSLPGSPRAESPVAGSRREALSDDEIASGRARRRPVAPATLVFNPQATVIEPDTLADINDWLKIDRCNGMTIVKIMVWAAIIFTAGLLYGAMAAVAKCIDAGKRREYQRLEEVDGEAVVVPDFAAAKLLAQRA